MNSSSLHQSPLIDLYPDDPPLMEFGGWEMPRDFGGIVQEHLAVREDIGVFDLSHMGRLIMKGSNVLENVEALFTRSLTSAEDGQALYGFFCDDDGGCLDDAILYRKSPEEIWMVVNAANRETIVEWLENRANSNLDDRTSDSVLLAVQGPGAPDVMSELNIPALPATPFRTNWSKGSMTASTGYSGEAGGEIWLDEEEGRAVFQEIIKQSIQLCGLGARDTLRLEKGFPLHGHELSQSIDPVTAGFQQFIDWDHEFTGRSALNSIRENGPEKTITGIKCDGRQSPRQGYPVRADNEEEIGEVTSGGFSPVLQKGIGMVKIQSGIPEDDSLEMQIRGQWQTVEQVKPPFV